MEMVYPRNDLADSAGMLFAPPLAITLQNIGYHSGSGEHWRGKVDVGGSGARWGSGF